MASFRGIKQDASLLCAVANRRLNESVLISLKSMIE